MPDERAVSGDDAFAATVAPADSLGSEETQAAPLAGALPPLPLVADEHYTQHDEIARGGMGRIRSARDERLHRQVAIKELLEPAGDQLTRFQREALITARLQHPGIVPVYEAGRWPSGEPFFAMKLVSGRPLDRVIAEALTLEERLALLPRMAAAADAIAYAHSQRVVHRDLKPGNILIGDFGETVVIDWGLAKDLEAVDTPESQNRVPRPAKRRESTSSSSTLTVAGAVMGTPAYMAPEQARGEPVDERADVFALGAMLYHLLAGVPPYNARTATDVIAAAALGRVVPLREREPGAPEDLVAIVERAMAPLPVERYPHAGELAEEVRRFLTGQLVSAHRYTTLQRLARFVKRHRAAVTIGAVATIAMSVGGAWAVYNVVEARDRAERAAVVADARRAAAENLIHQMLDDMKERLVAIGRIDLLSNLGAEVRAYYDAVAQMPGGIPLADVDRMALAIELVGRAERDSGQSDRALKTWTDGRALVERAVAGVVTPETRFKRMMLARLDSLIATIQQMRGNTRGAIAGYDKAKAQFAVLAAEAPNDATLLRWAADNHDKLGDVLRNHGRVGDAFEEYTAAKLAREHASSHTSSRPSFEVRALATSHLKLGSIHQVRGNSSAALAAYRRALRLCETVLENQPDHVEVQEEALGIQDAIAELQRQIGDVKSAIDTYHQALPMIASLVQRDPQNVFWKHRRGGLLADLGFALLDTGDYRAGLVQLEAAAEIQRELVARDPKSSTYQMALSRSYMRSGDGHLYLGAYNEGIGFYARSLEIRERLAAKDPKSAPYRRATAWSLHKLGNAYALKGDTARAIEHHEKVLAIRNALAEEAPTQSGYKNELASTEIALGKLLARIDSPRSKLLVAAGIERARALVAIDAVSNEWRETLTQGLIAHSDCAKIAGDPRGRRASLDEALTLAAAGAQRAPQNPQWQGFLAEVHAGYAELATTAADRTAAWRAVRELLEPLATAGRLPASRKILLDRARAQR